MKKRKTPRCPSTGATASQAPKATRTDVTARATPMGLIRRLIVDDDQSACPIKLPDVATGSLVRVSCIICAEIQRALSLSRRRLRDEEVDAARRVEPRGHVVPVPQVPHGLEECLLL